MEKTQVHISTFRAKSLKLYVGYPHFKDSEVNILGSYGTTTNDYHDVIFNHPDLYHEIILDSGVFSKNNSNNNSVNYRITIDGYKVYCKYTKEKFILIMNYDEKFMPGGFEFNHENQQALEKAGIAAIPVIHDYQSEKFDEIDFYLRHGYDLIALGYAEHKKKYVPKAVKRITNHGCKVHVLGITSYDILKDLPVHYCDSSNWTQAVAFGYVYFWNEKKKLKKQSVQDKTDTIRFWDKEGQERKPGYYYDDYPFKSDLDHYLKKMFGFTWVDLYGPKMHVNREVVNIHYHVILQQKLREYHQRNNIFQSYQSAVSLSQSVQNGDFYGETKH